MFWLFFFSPTCFLAFSWAALIGINWMGRRGRSWPLMPACKCVVRFCVNLKSYFSFDIIVDNSNGKPVNAVLKIVTGISCWHKSTAYRNLFEVTCPNLESSGLNFSVKNKLNLMYCFFKRDITISCLEKGIRIMWLYKTKKMDFSGWPV